MEQITSKHANPFIIALPNLGVGLLWSMNMTLIPELVKTHTPSAFLVTLLVSMGAFTGTWVQWLAGRLSDHSSFKMGKRKPFILMGTVATAIFMILMPLAQNYIVLFLIGFMFYFSLNFYQGPYYSLLPESVESTKFGITNGLARVVSVLGAGIIYLLWFRMWSAWRPLPFITGALFCIATVSVVFFFVKEDASRYKKPEKVAFDFFKFPSVVRLNLAVFFAFLTFGIITTLFTRYCLEALNIDQNASGFALLVLTLAGAAAAAPIGLLSDKIPRRHVLAMSLGLFALGLFFAFFVHTIMALYGVMILMGIGYVGIQITIFAINAEIVPPERLGEFVGVLNFSISLSQFIGANTMGLLLDTFGYSLYFPLAFASMLVALIITLFSKFTRHSDPHGEEV